MTELVQQPFKGHQVLPLNATPLERAMADVAADFFLTLDIPISKLWNPWQCPEQYLPFLAWALSVDVWDEDWPEAVKRRVIAASPMVHRKKGTRWAVEEALKSIGLSAEITEWWETAPHGRHGTFEVTALLAEQIYKGGAIFDEKLQDLAFQVVRSSKPKSRIFDLRLKAEFQDTIGLASSATGMMFVSETVSVQSNPALSTHAGLATTATSLQIIRTRMEISL